jgi:hypothetical protein
MRRIKRTARMVMAVSVSSVTARTTTVSLSSDFGPLRIKIMGYCPHIALKHKKGVRKYSERGGGNVKS